MKRILAVLLAVVLISQGVGSIAYAQEQTLNEVCSFFNTLYLYRAQGDSVINELLSSTMKATFFTMHNLDDGSNKAVGAPTFTFATELPVLWAHPLNLVSTDPYTWELPDIAEGRHEARKVRVETEPYEYKLGFSASRQLDKVVFDESGSQTVTIIATPEEEMDALYIELRIFFSDETLTATITDLAQGTVIGGGLFITIDKPEVGTTYTRTVTLDVELNPGVDIAAFRPRVTVAARHKGSAGSFVGNTVSLTTEVGTAVVETDICYSWYWEERLHRRVTFARYCTILPVAQASADLYLAPVGSEFTFDGSASQDPDGTIESWEWDFDDGDSESGSTVTHAYAAAGLYEVVLTVTDDLGAQSTCTVMAVVYDPDAGFATGGGWFIPGGKTSDDGDFLPGLDSTSPANFGFVVKYKHGATTPEGQLEFQYCQGDFNLHSDGMEWLVVTNDNWVKFHGTATIKGLEGVFPFRVDARDTDHTGGDLPDKFIIKIWAPGADPDKDDPIYKASGELEGGNIVIHTK